MRLSSELQRLICCAVFVVTSQLGCLSTGIYSEATECEHGSSAGSVIHGQGHVEPSQIVFAYLKALKEHRLGAAFGYESTYRKGGMDRSSYVRDLEGKLDWSPVSVEFHGQERQNAEKVLVMTSCVVCSEGELTIARADFEVVLEKGGWKIDEMTWGNSLPVELPSEWAQELGLSRLNGSEAFLGVL